MKDLFSNQSKQYAAFRPRYPQELYDFIFNHVKHFDSAWDAGTGNGQVAADLAKKFKIVLATDISAKQLDNAHKATNIVYSQAGEVTDFSEQTFDLITVGQALHWFDSEKFYNEVRRVAKSNSLLAVWGYGLLSINAEIDPHLKYFYAKIVGPFWDPERNHIDKHYETIPFPFEEIKTPTFRFSFEWSVEDFRGYLGTWSSVQKYIQKKGIDPVDDFINSIRAAWGMERRMINFPLFLRAGLIQ